MRPGRNVLAGLAAVLAGASSFAGAGCGGDDGSVPGFPDQSVPVDIAEGADIFRIRCQSCHGRAGVGGPIGPAVDDREMWDELGDEGVRVVVVRGDGQMPAYADLLDDDEVDAVVAYLRALAERPVGS